MLHYFIFLWLCSSPVIGTCTGGVSRCQWITWNAWNDCSQTCGGGVRTRTRPLCCDTTLTFDECVTSCGLDNDPTYEREYCNTICNNGALWTGSSCSCNDGYYGSCCQNVVTCGNPSTIANGYYTGNNFDYGGQIQYFCNSGYGMISGDEIHSCSRRYSFSYTGYWDGSVPVCVDINTCRSNPCQNGATCVNGYGEYTCNCVAGYSGDHCQFDIQPPVYTNCSDDILVYSEDPTSTYVTWIEPVFDDPLGNEIFVTSNYEENNYVFPWGEYTVQYVADKHSNGMRSECLFIVKVLPFPCPDINPPANGAFACNGWNSEYTTVCMLFCEEDKKAPGSGVEDVYVCGGSGQWSTEPTVGCTENRLSTEVNNKFYTGNCSTDEQTQRDIQETYFSLLNNSSWAELCTDSQWSDVCNVQAVSLIC